MNGFVCVNKPQGMTSFSVASRVRRCFGIKKSGHTGTLDPMATGVLVVALGAATRFIELIPVHDKSYKAGFLLGKTTDTLDITGTVTGEREVNCKAEDVRRVLKSFTGEQSQLPPMYSAIRKNGVRLYELARQGVEIEREKRDVTIYSLEMVSAEESSGRYEIEVSCSSGTYIRSLVSDIGDALETGAVMTSLERTAANGLSLQNSFTLGELDRLSHEGRLEEAVLSIDSLLDYPGVTVSEAQARRFSNGGELELKRVRGVDSDGLYCVFSPQKDFLGVGLADFATGNLTVRKAMSK